jgi:hypothetical protein
MLGQDSSVGTGRTVRGSNLGGGHRHQGPPSLLNNGYRVIPGVKWPGLGFDHTPPSSAEVKQ